MCLAFMVATSQKTQGDSRALIQRKTSQITTCWLGRNLKDCFQPCIHLRLYLIWNGYTNVRNTFGFEQSAGLCTGVNLEMEPPYRSQSFPQVAYNLQLALPPPKPNKTSKTLPRLRKRTSTAGCSLCAMLRLCWRGRARMIRPSRAYINRPLLAGSRQGKAEEFSVLSLRGIEWPQPEHIFLPVQNILPLQHYKWSSEACLLSAPHPNPFCMTVRLFILSQGYLPTQRNLALHQAVIHDSNHCVSLWLMIIHSTLTRAGYYITECHSAPWGRWHG